MSLLLFYPSVGASVATLQSGSGSGEWDLATVGVVCVVNSSFVMSSESAVTNGALSVNDPITRVAGKIVQWDIGNGGAQLASPIIIHTLNDADDDDIAALPFAVSLLGGAFASHSSGIPVSGDEITEDAVIVEDGTGRYSFAQIMRSAGSYYLFRPDGGDWELISACALDTKVTLNPVVGVSSSLAEMLGYAHPGNLRVLPDMLVVDSFTGANGTAVGRSSESIGPDGETVRFLAAAWDEVTGGTWTISSNNLIWPGGDTPDQERYVQDIGTDDDFIFRSVLDPNAVAVGVQIGVIIRNDNNDSVTVFKGYAVTLASWATTPVLAIKESDESGGTFTDRAVGSGTYSAATRYIIEISVRNSVLRATTVDADSGEKVETISFNMGIKFAGETHVGPYIENNAPVVDIIWESVEVLPRLQTIPRF